jgi:hypothetical protein
MQGPTRDRTAGSRVRRKELALVVAITAAVYLGCGAGIATAVILALSSGGGGGGTETTAEGEADLVPSLPFTDRFLGALVIPNGVIVSDLGVTQNGLPLQIEENVPSSRQLAIQQALLQRGIFDPAKEYLRFWQTSAPITIVDGDAIRLRFVQSQNGQPVSESRIGFGGSNETDFDNPLLPNFQAHDNPFGSAVPAISPAGRALLLVGTAALAFLLLRERRSGARR